MAVAAINESNNPKPCDKWYAANIDNAREASASEGQTILSGATNFNANCTSRAFRAS